MIPQQWGIQNAWKSRFRSSPFRPIRSFSKTVHNDATKRFQHLAFMKHALAILRPYRIKGPCRPHRYDRLSLSLYYSHQVGVVLAFQKTALTLNAKHDATKRLLPCDLSDRLDLWKSTLEAEDFNFREKTLLIALLNFVPPQKAS
jgi:hypothetical protein